MKATELPLLHVSSGFIARGLVSSRRAKGTGRYLSTHQVLDRLGKHLATAKQTVKASNR